MPEFLPSESDQEIFDDQEIFEDYDDRSMLDFLADQPESSEVEEDEARVKIQAVAWINMGYMREQCIAFVVSEGYSQQFATRIVDEALDLMTGDYGMG